MFDMSNEIMAMRNLEWEKAKGVLRGLLWMTYDTEPNDKANKIYAQFCKDFGDAAGLHPVS